MKNLTLLLFFLFASKYSLSQLSFGVAPTISVEYIYKWEYPFYEPGHISSIYNDLIVNKSYGLTGFIRYKSNWFFTGVKFYHEKFTGDVDYNRCTRCDRSSYFTLNNFSIPIEFSFSLLKKENSPFLNFGVEFVYNYKVESVPYGQWTPVKYKFNGNRVFLRSIPAFVGGGYHFKISTHLFIYTFLSIEFKNLTYRPVASVNMGYDKCKATLSVAYKF